jgi:aminoglycoside phosphotransferase (APT) family kinase protein
VLNERPPVEDRLVLCHGDFRNGNLLIDSQGLRAVLDWELAHVGHPWEDLGYFCANVWRFGRYDMPAGGFGSYQSLLDGYASVAGHAPSIAELKQWELMAALNWGVVTQTMVAIYESGMDSRLERAAVGRRLSESEIDILLLLDELEAAQ